MRGAQQAEGAQPKVKRASIDATKIIFSIRNIIKRQLILKKFKGRYSRYKWYIGTYHVYKSVNDKQKMKLTKLSYITDILRKYYPKGTIFYMTKEYTEDGYPHYHYLLGLEKDEWGCVPTQKTIRNTKLWTRLWKLGESFTFHDPKNEDNEYVPFYVNTKLQKLDMGARQRWFKHGIYQYLLYMFKYSNFDEFMDYYIHQKGQRP